LKDKENTEQMDFLLGPPSLFNPEQETCSNSANDNGNSSKSERINYTSKTCHLVPITPCDSENIRRVGGEPKRRFKIRKGFKGYKPEPRQKASPSPFRIRKNVQITCQQCGGIGYSRQADIKRGWGKYCSPACAKAAPRPWLKGKPVNRDQSGKNNPNWRGGISQNKVRYRERFQAKYPLKAEAHRLVHNAIARGDLVRQPCERCGTTERIHAHHDDYTKPLEVRWLCQSHHIQRHQELKREVSR
jgi:hypothetical protein